MRFIVDENLPRATVALLRDYGHQAAHASDIGLRGASDSAIAAHAQREGLSLLTRDLDYCCR